ncbi:hypothetical protein BD324DRAFT_611401 [Kockovaella imperatae]|uniref:Probable RNA-binding protein 18 n=1 Tax=Kockovaella imperatae TaxID=4999 RepID=A0A1Y1UR89_9TREE|nr:hypothetical protein BD324DRAFT_611401 [Kockovaella imperatae]ORX40583.1 hypothetical protein BD324DRAFT_611401 [Kockovaella imperatae]
MESPGSQASSSLSSGNVLTASHPSTSASGGKPDRLFVGNLSPTVDEYTLIQVFSKYGKITKLDFMFHKSGVLKGKPRGYAFLEFSNKDDALRAMVKLHDRLLRGRKLVVTYANSAPINDLPLITKGRRPTDAPKTTTLSLLKSNRRPQNAAAQIAAMEAKLATMAKTKPADEDYVPGFNQYPLGHAIAGSASPHSGTEIMEEDAIGEVAGMLAADDLQRELEAELNTQPPCSGSTDDPRSSQSPRSPAHDQRSTQSPAPPATQPAMPKLVPGAGLPSRPPTISNATASASNVNRSQARSEEIKRGLAGLPKKPVF